MATVLAQHVKTGEKRLFGENQWKLLVTAKNGEFAGTKQGYVIVDAEVIAKTFIPAELKKTDATVSIPKKAKKEISLG